jgi:hypothetical protein
VARSSRKLAKNCYLDIIRHEKETKRLHSDYKKITLGNKKAKKITRGLQKGYMEAKGNKINIKSFSFKRLRRSLALSSSRALRTNQRNDMLRADTECFWPCYPNNDWNTLVVLQSVKVCNCEGTSG